MLRNIRYTARKSEVVFAHSESARDELVSRLSIAKERIRVIPFGDLAIKMGRPLEQRKARKKIGLPYPDKICLVFGTIKPYKGTDELIRIWKQAQVRHKLVIVGSVGSHSFAEKLRKLANGCHTIDLRFSDNWLEEETLHEWLSAADCAIFNYRRILTSGAAPLARSHGLPIVIPHRVKTVDLSEPDPKVIRFDALDTDFCRQIERAVATPRDYDHAKKWRDATSWQQVAERTAETYRQIVTVRGPI
jgi:glycosyltransferase involved in cell wall biosynthesis